jgi:hypothetical protein
MSCNLQVVQSRRKPAAKVSIILLDWGVRESFHSVHYLNHQSVPREEYEVIWIEFYDRQPRGLRRLLKRERPGALDKWLVLGYPDNVHYHKHRMYNAGIIVAEGAICVFCDSDAIFQPTFVENVLNGLVEQPSSVIHVDEVRNYKKRFYPFNYPPIKEVLADGCVNWTGRTTTGLDNNPDMLHSANYGACMAAWRHDLIEIGGADEHIDYLGYICGPYEMTFRLTNLGREERWLRNEYLFHLWHPNTSGCNVEHKGPDDGRGMSRTAIALRQNGRVAPWKENLAIRYLRQHPAEPVASLLSMLVQEDDATWDAALAFDDVEPELDQEGYRGYNIIWYRGTWYGLRQDAGPFDPAKVRSQQYSDYFSAATRSELLTLLASQPPAFCSPVIAALRWLPLPRRFKQSGQRLLLRCIRAIWGAPLPRAWNDSEPHLIEEGYRGYNILYYRGRWYGLGQGEGAFDESKLGSDHGHRWIAGDSPEAVKAEIQQRQTFPRRLKAAARKLARLARLA